MMKKLKIMQSISLGMLIILLGLVVFLLTGIKSPEESIPEGGMNETGMGKASLIFIGCLVSIYTIFYGINFYRFWTGKDTINFHRVNKNIFFYITLFIVLFIIIVRRIVILVYVGPLIIPFSLIYLTSKMYVENYNLLQ